MKPNPLIRLVALLLVPCLAGDALIPAGAATFGKQEAALLADPAQAFIDVIPVETGIHRFNALMDSRFRGNDNMDIPFTSQALAPTVPTIGMHHPAPDVFQAATRAGGIEPATPADNRNALLKAASLERFQPFQHEPRVALSPGGLDLKIMEMFPDLEVVHFLNNRPFRVPFDIEHLTFYPDPKTNQRFHLYGHYEGRKALLAMQKAYSGWAEESFIPDDFQDRIIYGADYPDDETDIPAGRPQLGMEPFIVADLERRGARAIISKQLTAERMPTFEIRFIDRNGQEKWIIYTQADAYADRYSNILETALQNSRVDLILFKAFTAVTPVFQLPSAPLPRRLFTLRSGGLYVAEEGVVLRGYGIESHTDLVADMERIGWLGGEHSPWGRLGHVSRNREELRSVLSVFRYKPAAPTTAENSQDPNASRRGKINRYFILPLGMIASAAMECLGLWLMTTPHRLWGVLLMGFGTGVLLVLIQHRLRRWPKARQDQTFPVYHDSTQYPASRAKDRIEAVRRFLSSSTGDGVKAVMIVGGTAHGDPKESSDIDVVPITDNSPMAYMDAYPPFIQALMKGLSPTKIHPIMPLDFSAENLTDAFGWVDAFLAMYFIPASMVGGYLYNSRHPGSSFFQDYTIVARDRQTEETLRATMESRLAYHLKHFTTQNSTVQPNHDGVEPTNSAQIASPSAASAETPNTGGSPTSLGSEIQLKGEASERVIQRWNRFRGEPAAHVSLMFADSGTPPPAGNGPENSESFDPPKPIFRLSNPLSKRLTVSVPNGSFPKVLEMILECWNSNPSHRKEAVWIGRHWGDLRDPEPIALMMQEGRLIVHWLILDHGFHWRDTPLDEFLKINGIERPVLIIQRDGTPVIVNAWGGRYRDHGGLYDMTLDVNGQYIQLSDLRNMQGLHAESNLTGDSLETPAYAQLGTIRPAVATAIDAIVADALSEVWPDQIEPLKEQLAQIVVEGIAIRPGPLAFLRQIVRAFTVFETQPDEAYLLAEACVLKLKPYLGEAKPDDANDESGIDIPSLAGPAKETKLQSNIFIEEAKPEDLPEILQLRNKAYLPEVRTELRTLLSQDMLGRMIEGKTISVGAGPDQIQQGNFQVFVARSGQRLVGYQIAFRSLAYREGILVEVASLKDFRSHQVTIRLLAAGIRWLAASLTPKVKRINLHGGLLTDFSNQTAARLGFQSNRGLGEDAYTWDRWDQIRVFPPDPNDEKKWENNLGPAGPARMDSSLLKNEDGQDLAEYAFMMAAIALGIGRFSGILSLSFDAWFTAFTGLLAIVAVYLLILTRIRAAHSPLPSPSLESAQRIARVRRFVQDYPDPNILGVVVFGSVARGKANPRDFDYTLVRQNGLGWKAEDYDDRDFQNYLQANCPFEANRFHSLILNAEMDSRPGESFDELVRWLFVEPAGMDFVFGYYDGLPLFQEWKVIAQDSKGEQALAQRITRKIQELKVNDQSLRTHSDSVSTADPAAEDAHGKDGSGNVLRSGMIAGVLTFIASARYAAAIAPFHLHSALTSALFLILLSLVFSLGGEKVASWIIRKAKEIDDLANVEDTAQMMVVGIFLFAFSGSVIQMGMTSIALITYGVGAGISYGLVIATLSYMLLGIWTPALCFVLGISWEDLSARFRRRFSILNVVSPVVLIALWLYAVLTAHPSAESTILQSLPSSLSAFSFLPMLVPKSIQRHDLYSGPSLSRAA